ncbi:MAG: hypothetical protein ACLR13_07720 [Acutalibacteraceae bacterium]
MLESQRKKRKMLLVLEICSAAAALAFTNIHTSKYAGQADFTVGDVRISHNSKSVGGQNIFGLRHVMLLRC